MFTPWFLQEAIETIRVELVANVVSKVLSQASYNAFSLKNAGIRKVAPYFGNGLLLNMKGQLASPNKWIN
jgi:hypothetical protein